MSPDNAGGTLSQDQDIALINARTRMVYALEDLADQEYRYPSMVGTMEDIEELERAFHDLFGPEGRGRYLGDPLTPFREGC